MLARAQPRVEWKRHTECKIERQQHWAHHIGCKRKFHSLTGTIKTGWRTVKIKIALAPTWFALRLVASTPARQIQDGHSCRASRRHRGDRLPATAIDRRIL